MVVPIMTDSVLSWKQHGNSMWTENISSMVSLVSPIAVRTSRPWYVLDELVDVECLPEHI